MTAKRLRQALVGVPEDTEVVINLPPHSRAGLVLIDDVVSFIGETDAGDNALPDEIRLMVTDNYTYEEFAYDWKEAHNWGIE